MAPRDGGADPQGADTEYGSPRDSDGISGTVDEWRVDELEGLLQECEDLLQKLEVLAQADVLHVPRDSHHHGFKTKSTV